MPTMPSHVLRRLATAIVVALTLLGALDARAETIYSDTILTTSTPNTSNQDEVRVSSDLNNCRASEGCLGKSSLFVVGSFSDAGDLIDSGVYDKDQADDADQVIANHMTFTFFLRQDQVNAILDSAGGLGIFGSARARISRSCLRRRASASSRSAPWASPSRPGGAPERRRLPIARGLSGGSSPAADCSRRSPRARPPATRA